MLTLLRSGQSFWRTTEELSPSLREFWNKLGTLSGGLVPIFVEGEYVGALISNDCRIRRAWSDLEKETLSIAAQAIGAALTRQKLALETSRGQEQAALEEAARVKLANAELKRRSDLLSVIADESRALLQAVDLDAAIYRMMRRFGEATDLSRVFYIEQLPRPGADEHETDHHMLIEWCAVGMQRHPWLGIVPNDAIASYVAPARRGESVWLKVEEDSIAAQEEFGSIGVLSAGYAPIFIDGAYCGGIAFHDCKSARQWDAADIHALTAMANSIGAALQGERQRTRMITAERVRMAGEIHDGLQQTLIAISLHLGAVSKMIAGSELESSKKLLEAATRLVERGGVEVRRSVQALRPLDLEESTDLHEALNALCSRSATRSCSCKLVADPIPGTLPHAIESSIYRVAQEAVTNAMKHSSASEIRVKLIFTPTQAELSVYDNGVGLDYTKTMQGNTGYGMRNMKERAERSGGSFSVSPLPRQGTLVRASFALQR